MEEMKASIIRTRGQIAETNVEHPDYKQTYFERYLEARRQAGLKNAEDNTNNFIKFMVDDIDIGF
jgi:hypothetical protein